MRSNCDGLSETMPFIENTSALPDGDSGRDTSWTSTGKSSGLCRPTPSVTKGGMECFLEMCVYSSSQSVRGWISLVSEFMLARTQEAESEPELCRHRGVRTQLPGGRMHWIRANELSQHAVTGARSAVC